MTAVGRRHAAVDVVMAHLMHLVLDDSWIAREAGVDLRENFDVSLLRRARRRVRVALAERPSDIAHRAVATLDSALGA